MTITKAVNGQQTKYNELVNFFNISTSSINSIAEKWGLNAKQLHEICTKLNPDMVIYEDDSTPVLNTKNHQAYFLNTNFLSEVTNR